MCVLTHRLLLFPMDVRGTLFLRRQLNMIGGKEKKSFFSIISYSPEEGVKSRLVVRLDGRDPRSRFRSVVPRTILYRPLRITPCHYGPTTVLQVDSLTPCLHLRLLSLPSLA